METETSTEDTTGDETVEEEEEVEGTSDDAAEDVSDAGASDDGPAVETSTDDVTDAIDLDELATLVADKIRGERGNGSDEDELMAKVRRVIKEEKDSDRAEDRIADKVAAKVGGRAPDAPPAPEYRRLAKLLFGKRE